jgi:hypothetical protein
MKANTLAVCVLALLPATAAAQYYPNDPIAPALMQPLHHHSTEEAGYIAAMAQFIQAQGAANQRNANAMQRMVEAERQYIRWLLEREQARVEAERLRYEFEILHKQRRELKRLLAVQQRVPLSSPAVINSRQEIAWIGILNQPRFDELRRRLSHQVADLEQYVEEEERLLRLEAINGTCQEFVAMLYEAESVSHNRAYADGRRFINRLYDSLLEAKRTA